MTSTSQTNNLLDVSVLVPVSERHDVIRNLFVEHRKILKELNLTYEFIFIIDGKFEKAEKELKQMHLESSEDIKVIKFNRPYGESKALSAGFKESSGKLVLTIASYFQIQPEAIIKLFKTLTPSVDVAYGCRFPRQDNIINQIQSRIFHWIVNKISKESFNDISCGVRLMRREVLEKIRLYGDMHRFIPLLAKTKGFQVKEVPLPQASQDIHLRVYKPGVYLRRVLDLLNLFFLIKFTQKPLRFFGLLGSAISLVGAIVTGITTWQRIIGGQPLSERPLFLAGVLFILIGLQTFFIGLVAEIIIFTHMSHEPDYNIEEIIE